MTKTTIIALVGQSGSGKSALSAYLKTKGYNSIVSYTTRPMREGETDGVEHWFVTENDVPPKDKMLAYAHFGGYHYWTSFNQLTFNAPTLYIIDEKALIEMTERVGDTLDIIPIYIKRDDLSDIERDRRNRDKDRVILPDKYYAAIIENNGTLEEFFKKAEETINKLI